MIRHLAILGTVLSECNKDMMNDPSLCSTKQTNGQWPELASTGSTHFSDQKKDDYFFMASGAFSVQKLNCQFFLMYVFS